MQQPQIAEPVPEFWRLPMVRQQVGMSKTEIYRRAEQGQFPAPRRYPGSRLVYWLSTDVLDWQRQALGG